MLTSPCCGSKGLLTAQGTEPVAGPVQSLLLFCAPLYTKSCRVSVGAGGG